MRELTDEEEYKLIRFEKALYEFNERLKKKSILYRIDSWFGTQKNMIDFAIQGIETFLTHDVEDLKDEMEEELKR